MRSIIRLHDPGLWLVPLVCWLSPLVTWGQWTTHVYGPHNLAAALDTSQVQESSGVVPSRMNANLYWTNEDSGAGPRVWVFRMSAADISAGTAKNMGYVDLPGASSVDWEDIANGPAGLIYLFDGGDNPPCSRTDKQIHRFSEPTIDPDGPTVSLSTAFETMRFEYPDSSVPFQPADTNDERYDAESLLVHPVSGDFYVVTKRTNDGTAAIRVFMLPAASITWNSGVIHVLTFVTDLTPILSVQTTGADVDAEGRRVLIRAYNSAYEFILPEGQPFNTVFGQTPRVISLSGEPQGEGICYARNGGDIVTTSEGSPMRVYLTPWQLANLRAESIGATQATVRWDTAGSLSSSVDYGVTTGYGCTIEDVASVQSHAIQLTHLAPNRQYFYRVRSGSLSYPPSEAATNIFFVTQAGVNGDFDGDHDVDLEDFGHLQACLSGSGVSQNRPDCQDTKMDSDPDVDQDDVRVFQRCMSGASVPADPDCAE